MRTKIIVVLLLSILTTLSTYAQKYSGFNQGNYNGIYGMMYNPAKISTSRQTFGLNLFTVNAYANNNVYNINSDSIKQGIFSYKNVAPNKPASVVAPYFEMLLPSFHVTVGNKLGVGFSSRLRLFNQIHNANQEVVNIINGARAGTITAINDPLGFNMNVHAITDYGLSAGYKVFDNDKMAFSVGGSLRMYKGVGYLNFLNKGIQGTYIDNSSTNQPDVVNISNINLLISTSAYEYQKIVDQFTTPKDAFGALFGSKTAGKGLGGDIGGELIIKKDKNLNYSNSYRPYFAKVGLSILDIGSIKYNGVKQAVIKGSGSLNVDSIEAYQNDIQKIREYAGRRGFTVDSATVNGIKSGLPTTLNLYGDFGISKNFFVTAALMSNLQKTNGNAPFFYSQFTVSPRFETKIFDVAVPVTYNTMSKDVKLGAALRLGPLHVGSDDLKLLFNDSKGGSAYLGFKFGINKKNKKKKVVEEKTIVTKTETRVDSVIIHDTKTVIQTQTDTVVKVVEKQIDADYDGIVDSLDRCPTEHGKIENRGCPDKDNDGVVDIDDRCPEEAGVVALKGCPDRDMDGVADIDDKCPDTKGNISNAGCPEVKQEVIKRINYAAKAIQFETGKADIKPSSYAMLDEIATIIREYPDYILQIEGHTDNVGNPEKNMLLSQKRAESVETYLSGKGIDRNRFEATGYGDTKPLVPNTTVQNKAKNRRVDLKLALKN